MKNVQCQKLIEASGLFIMSTFIFGLSVLLSVEGKEVKEMALFEKKQKKDLRSLSQVVKNSIKKVARL